jgi:CRP-like cAMP-binding protein
LHRLHSTKPRRHKRRSLVERFTSGLTNALTDKVNALTRTASSATIDKNNPLHNEQSEKITHEKIAELREGAIFGEACLLMDLMPGDAAGNGGVSGGQADGVGKRTAGVVALVDSEYYELGRETFRLIMADHPVRRCGWCWCVGMPWWVNCNGAVVSMVWPMWGMHARLVVLSSPL